MVAKRNFVRTGAAVLAAFAILGSFLVFTAAPASSGPVHCVRPGGGFFCDSSIQDAVDAADPGATIWVLPGTYFENVDIPPGKDGITIRGLVRMRTTVDADDPNTGNGFDVDANNVTIMNLQVRNGVGDGIEVTGDGFVGANLDVQGANSDCLAIESGADDATISNGVFRRCGSEALEIDGDDATVFGNTFANCDSDCVNVDADGLTFTDNFLTVAADGAGLEVTGDGFTITGNRAENFDDEAYDVDCSPCAEGGLLANNLARFATDSDYGFEVDADAGPGTFVVRDNQAITNDTGFVVRGDGIELRNNVAIANGDDRNEHGFEIRGDNHLLVGNLARGSAGDGFDIGGDGNVLENNTSVNNSDDGFDVRDGATNTTLRGNVAEDNFGVGFEISPANSNPAADGTTLTANTASGNRVDFCDEGTNTVLSGNTFGTTGACVIDD